MMLQPTYLQEIAARCFANLSTLDPTLLDDIRGWAADRADPLPWGSACSGTDSLRWTYQAMADALNRIGIQVSFEHRFSAEMNDNKRQFIQVFASPPFVAGDLFDLTRERVWNYQSCTPDYPKTYCSSPFCFVAGFVCKAVSSLNSDRKTARSAVWDSTSSTGSTLLGVILYIQQWRPLTIILENVLGLKTRGQHKEVKRRLESLGYAVVIFEMSPLDVGFPQDRRRLYFAAVSGSLVTECGMMREDVESLASALMACVLAGHEPLNVDSVLFAEESTYVQEMKAQERRDYERRLVKVAQGSSCKSAGGSKLWVHKHKAASVSCAQSRWSDDLQDLYPAYKLLPDREKDLLDHCKVGFPDARQRCVNVSQSKPSICEGHLPCLTPKGTFWLAWRGRPLYGREALLAQGLPILEHEWDKVSFLSDSLLRDLGGNAFCAASLLPVQAVLLALVARLAQGAARRFLPEEQPGPGSAKRVRLTCKTQASDAVL